ncbi:MAG: 23S rRNA (adenine(2503)-C(2))-methyltransferase RlmN [Candidatus Enteromonas sp.]|nr:23S rRNA (adenine(2503)-C(2))-methyltransferase RlmN [Candidatus Enteromonas sp.]
MKNLLGLPLSSLTEEFLSRGQTKYRGKQVFSWIYQKGVLDFSKMSDVSLSFRETLQQEYCLTLPKIFTEQHSDDGTIKLLLEMEDGAKVETVLMPYNYGNAICVSSEVGCSMGCAFCASGLHKKERNLTAAEMMGEVLVMNNVLLERGERLTHIVVMGTGEPFDNYDNVLSFLKCANDQNGLAIGARHITVSTCGLVEGIRAFGKEGYQFNLAISLHAPNQEIRETLMPISWKYKMDELFDAIHEYEENSSRRVTLEYILLSGINDSLEHADMLAKLIRDHDVFAYVNLIPYNEVVEKPFKRTPRPAIKAFADRLLQKGITTTVRKEFGGDIDAACGQLRAKVLGEKKK